MECSLLPPEPGELFSAFKAEHMWSLLCEALLALSPRELSALPCAATVTLHTASCCMPAAHVGPCSWLPVDAQAQLEAQESPVLWVTLPAPSATCGGLPSVCAEARAGNCPCREVLGRLPARCRPLLPPHPHRVVWISGGETGRHVKTPGTQRARRQESRTTGCVFSDHRERSDR